VRHCGEGDPDSYSLLRTASSVSGGAVGASVYSYSGNPFQPGPLPVSNVTLNKDDGIPYHTEGKFPVIQ